MHLRETRLFQCPPNCESWWLLFGVSDCAAQPHLPGDLRVTKCEQSPGSEREVTATPLSESPASPSCPSLPPHGHSADPTGSLAVRPVVRPIVTEHYRLGYQECLSEAMHFLVEVEGYFAGDSLCVKLISHLQKHCDKIVKGMAAWQ